MKEHILTKDIEIRDNSSIAKYLFCLPAYKRYSEVLNIVDTIILDIETLQYKPQALVLSALFCVIALALKILTPVELIRLELDQPLDNKTSGKTAEYGAIELKVLDSPDFNTKVVSFDNYVLLFSEFLQDSFGIVYEELAPTIEYVCQYAGGLKLASTQQDKGQQSLFCPGQLHALKVDPNVSRNINFCDRYIFYISLSLNLLLFSEYL